MGLASEDGAYTSYVTMGTAGSWNDATPNYTKDDFLGSKFCVQMKFDSWDGGSNIVYWNNKGGVTVTTKDA